MTTLTRNFQPSERFSQAPGKAPLKDSSSEDKDSSTTPSTFFPLTTITFTQTFTRKAMDQALSVKVVGESPVPAPVLLRQKRQSDR